MAATTTDGNEISREEVQAAIAKAVELRALHAVLMQGGNMNMNMNMNISNLRLPAAAHHAPQFSGHDYPVFTPSYEEDAPWPTCYQQLQLENSSTVSDCWNDYVNGKKTVNSHDDPIINSYCKTVDSFSIKKSLPSDDHNSIANSTVIISPSHSRSRSQDFCKHTNRRNSCNKCNPAIISIETDSSAKKVKSSKSVVPLIESHSSVQTHQKNRGINFSWLRLKKKKNKIEETTSPNRTTAESDRVSQISKETEIVSIEMLKKELVEAQESRATALQEVSGMKSSLEELKLKLEYLETYCEELKQALKQAIQTQSSNESNKLDSLPERGESLPVMPVSDEVMVEGFLQIVSETRSSVKQFCKTLITQIDETDHNLTESLNSLLKPYKLSLDSKFSKAVLYHLVAIINQALFQDFENSIFQKNGCPKFLDPNEDQQSQFASFVGLRNLSWNEVLRKGTKFYSEEFSRFCDQKMSGIISGLSWTRPWPEQMLQSFFVAGKCVWLLHLLAFSFSPPIGILRVEENRGFDPHYMEDLFMEKRRSNGPYRVKAMAMPGFYVQDRVLKCKVICRYNNKSIT
ncbi:IRK-interacting protein-like [Impatiens glandulifera]|uniref:IRK-interacting protein-like n=1 Tax=Impatiens glandulifera TaxID=253017 RepID=UPI001FB0BE1F|nr:IRK-interacting protein-like [Impatiens glandulifera]